MRNRVRKYTAVMMTLLLCLGMWFGHSNLVKAEVPVTGELYVNIWGMREDGSLGKVDEVVIGELAVTGFSGSEAEGYTGTIQLTAEQTTGLSDDNRSLIYWYKMVDNALSIVAKGNTPTLQISNLDGVSVKPIEGADGSVESYMLTGNVYAEYGASHTVTYVSNYDMSGEETESITVPYMQENPDTTTGVSYSHPSEPVFTGPNGKVEWVKEGYLFAGWGMTDSGGVNAPETFDYKEKSATTAKFYAQWEEAATLDIMYMEEEGSSEVVSTDVVTQSDVNDTVFTFATAAALSKEERFFIGWKYYLDEDHTMEQVVPASAVCKDITIPEDDVYKSIIFYGKWKNVANLTLTYYLLETDDVAYTSEVITQENIEDTEFEFMPPWPRREGYVFDGWVYYDEFGALCKEDNGKNNPDRIEIDETSSEYPHFSRTYYGTWREALPAGSIISEGTSTLQADTPYVLGSGSWEVSNGLEWDLSVYTSGNTFYVTTEGDYTFRAQ